MRRYCIKPSRAKILTRHNSTVPSDVTVVARPPAPGRTIASGWTLDCECCGSYVAIYHIHHSVRDWEFTRVDFELPPSHESIKIHFWSAILAYVLSPTPRQIIVSLALFFFFYLWLSFLRAIVIFTCSNKYTTKTYFHWQLIWCCKYW